MSRDNNNEPSQQSSGAPVAGRQPARQATLPTVDLGIDYNQTIFSPYVERQRVMIDLSGYEPTEKGAMQKVAVVSVKKRDKNNAQQDGVVATTSSTPTP